MYHLQQLLCCEMALRSTRKGWILCQEFEPLVYLLGSLPLLFPALFLWSALCSWGQEFLELEGDSAETGCSE